MYMGVGQVVRQLQFIAGLFQPAAGSMLRNLASRALACKAAALPLRLAAHSPYPKRYGGLNPAFRPCCE